jgi:hypothetical protein
LEAKTSFKILEDGLVAMERRVYLPDVKNLQHEKLSEAHESKLIVHHGSITYHSLKEFY